MKKKRKIKLKKKEEKKCELELYKKEIIKNIDIIAIKNYN